MPLDSAGLRLRLGSGDRATGFEYKGGDVFSPVGRGAMGRSMKDDGEGEDGGAGNVRSWRGLASGPVFGVMSR